MLVRNGMFNQKIQLGVWASLWAVAFHGVRLVQNRLWSNGRRVTPNSPCPCGSGKKFRRCHGSK